jgi:hypothetical protein
MFQFSPTSRIWNRTSPERYFHRWNLTSRARSHYRPLSVYSPTMENSSLVYVHYDKLDATIMAAVVATIATVFRLFTLLLNRCQRGMRETARHLAGRGAPIPSN